MKTIQGNNKRFQAALTFTLLFLLTGFATSSEDNTEGEAVEAKEHSFLDGFDRDLDSAKRIKQEADFSDDGADTCISCHDEDSEHPVLAIFNTAHGNRGAHDGPFAKDGLECETCHGPAGKHSKKRLRRGETREPMIRFESGEAYPVEDKNAICLGCHQDNELNHWQGSQHQMSGGACVDCHQIHSNEDPMTDKLRQTEKCGSCHSNQLLALNRASSHPLKYGQMACADCHQPHDANSEHLLIGDTVNETCYQCHAEKRGPYLWEHQPVSEDCANCHLPHGSNQPAMLTQRAPYLCQSCHSADGHVSLSLGSDNLTSGTPSALMLGRSCANCHSQVHGSNHPSGSRLQR